jgi:hypothetical protein
VCVCVCVCVCVSFAYCDYLTTVCLNFVCLVQRPAAAASDGGDASMQIFVKMLHTGKTITIDVDLTDSVGCLKDFIQNREGIPSWRQFLTFAGKPLEDQRTLAQYHIQRESSILLNLRMVDHKVPFQIFVQTMASHQHCRPLLLIDVKFSEYIFDVKTKIADKVDIPVHDQRLFFHDMELRNDCMVAQHQIYDQSTVIMFSRTDSK